MRKVFSITFKVILPLLFGGAILYWMYRNFDFQKIDTVLWHEMDWTWMILSFPFCILAQAFRAIRWRQTLEPVGERPRLSSCINAIFVSYAASLVVPRVGEFTRCGILKRHDGVSFSKALGTVVTERAVDMLIMLLMTGVALVVQMPVLNHFFSSTGTRLDSIFDRFTATGYLVTAVCAAAALVLVFMLVRKMTIYNKVKDVLHSLWQGVASLRHIRGVTLYLVYSLAIWVCYFLHYYLTFFCFDATAHLSLGCAFASFVVGSIAVIVPTPNGAGPWHFAVKTMLIIYGVQSDDALYFVLIVHTVQTLLVALLGICSSVVLALRKAPAEIRA